MNNKHGQWIIGATIAVVVLSLMFNQFPWQRSFWITGQQMGTLWTQLGQPEKAAEVFTDPFAKGVSYFRASDFEAAAKYFAQDYSEDASYNLGNANVMLGRYSAALEAYDQALVLRPEWPEAKENRALAQQRYAMLKREGGIGTDGKLGADGIDFSAQKPSSPSEPSSSETMTTELSDAQAKALWLQQTQVKPQTFLRAKLRYQLAVKAEESEEARQP